MPIFTLNQQTEKKLAVLMEGWVRYVRRPGDDNALVDHAVIYLKGAAAALSEISYQNDAAKTEFERAIKSVVDDLSNRGEEALKEWLTKLVDPKEMTDADLRSAALSRAFGGGT